MLQTDVLESVNGNSKRCLSGRFTPNAIVHASSATQPQPGDPIEAIFSSPVTFVSLTGLDVGYNGFVLSAYDAVSGGNLLDTDQFFGLDPIGMCEYFTLSLNAVGIRRVEFSQVQNILDDTTAYDNFVFDTVVIPIPAAVWLFGSGLLGLIGIARRKKAV